MKLIISTTRVMTFTMETNALYCVIKYLILIQSPPSKSVEYRLISNCIFMNMYTVFSPNP